MFSSRWVRGDVLVRQSSQELSVSSVMILRLSRSGYVTVLLPPYFKQSFHEFLLLEITWCDFVNSWGSLLDGGASACVVLILGLAWFCLLVFGIVDRFRGVSVRTADIEHWELFTYELYHLCMEESSYSKIRQEFLFLDPMRVCIVYMLHAEEILDIGVNGILVISSMFKDDGQHELQDLRVIA
ncbi:hypothetical protein YC2023_062565 [Brassica napus]